MARRKKKAGRSKPTKKAPYTLAGALEIVRDKKRTTKGRAEYDKLTNVESRLATIVGQR